MKKIKKLTVVVPAFNEEKTIIELVNRVLAVKISKEVIIIDDGSVDQTFNLLKENFGAHQDIKLIQHVNNIGKGYAITTGIRKATGDIVIIQDADLEYDPNDYHNLIKPIVSGKYHAVYGSRFINTRFVLFGKNKTPMPLHWIGNRFLTFVTNVLYKDGISDMETCYKVLTSDLAKKLKLKSKRFNIEPEITAKILKQGYKIKEVPISYLPRTYHAGKKITWKDGVIALFTLTKYKFMN